MTQEVKTQRSRKGMFTGLLILAAGVIWLLDSMGFNAPNWLFRWPIIVIIIGVFSGLNDGFRRPITWILIGTGAAFTLSDILYIPVNLLEYFWPVMVIIIGLIILIRPKKERVIKNDLDGNTKVEDENNFEKGNVLDGLAIFNATKKNIFSKNFRGGETVTVFGGTEINLLQADFDRPITIEAVVVFGGLKLIVPPNWDVRIEATNILAGIDDKRSSSIQVVPENKVLILTGIVVFGGIDIVSY